MLSEHLKVFYGHLDSFLECLKASSHLTTHHLSLSSALSSSLRLPKCRLNSLVLTLHKASFCDPPAHILLTSAPAGLLHITGSVYPLQSCTTTPRKRTLARTPPEPWSSPVPQERGTWLPTRIHLFTGLKYSLKLFLSNRWTFEHIS